MSTSLPRLLATLLTGLLAIVAAFRLTAAAEPALKRSPAALAAERTFFEVLNGGAPRDRGAALYSLMAAYAGDPRDARTNVLLGLNHLWLAAEGDRTNPRVIEELILAERFLARAQTLEPVDRRIPSWLVPARLSLAAIEGESGRKESTYGELLDAYKENPGFHSFSVALIGFGSSRESPAFQRGLDALRQATGCGAGNPSCRNAPHWPHNREAFQTFHADYELKAGHPERAAELLRAVQAEPDYPRWPFRGEAEDRLKNLELYAKLFANADPGDDPPALTALEGGITCQSCHRGT